MPKARGWTFVINNYTERDLDGVLEMECQGCKAGHEVGKEGTPHIQGAVFFSDEISRKNLSKILPRANLQIMKGTWEDQDYCLKDGCIIRNDGTGSVQGKRRDIDAMMVDVKAGASDVELIEKYPNTFSRTMKMVDRYREATDKRFRNWMTEGVWIYGPTKVGKSEMAFENYHPDTHYVHEIEDKGWWDRYNGQDIVIFNDFRGQISYDAMLTLLDRWPKFVPKRGRAPVPFLAKKVIITSSLSPEECYHRRAENDSIEQLLRRLTVIKRERDPNLD